jgi:subtilisin-like proprotein convertase family protein
VLVTGVLLAALIAVAPASAATFTQNADIVDPGIGTATPYPSQLRVQGLQGLITDVNVRLDNPEYDRMDDLDIVLVSPDQDAVILMSDACGLTFIPTGTEFLFDQAAPNAIPDSGECNGGPYRPAQYEGFGPGEDGFYGGDAGTLDAFNGENANGYWSLYVRDDADMSGDMGATFDSWSLDITVGTSQIHIPGGQPGVATSDPYPVETDVIGFGGTVITDLDVVLAGLTHGTPRDLDIFLEGPLGQKVWLISDVCGGPSRWTDLDLRLDDEATASLLQNPGEEPECDVTTAKPTTYETDSDGEFTDPAPPIPPSDATSLSAFDLTDPVGTWKLWAVSDNEGDNGFLIDGYDLLMTTRPAADVGFSVSSQVGLEGGTVTVDVVRGGASPLGRGSVVVATQSDTAKAGQDFVPVSETLTFLPGETTKTISVPIVADGGFEPEQGFSLALGLAEGDAKVGTPAAVGITIPADAQQPVDDTPTGNEDKPPPATFTPANVLTRPPSVRRCRKAGDTITFRPTMPPGIAILRSEVYVGGKKIEDNIGTSAVAPIVLTMQGRKMKVRIKLTAQDGRVVNVRKTFRRCARKKR